MRRALLLGFLAVVSCVTSTPVMAPNGGRAWYIECPRDQAACIEEAAEHCPNGYDVIDRGGTHGAIAQTNYYTGQTVVTPIYRGNLTVQCRAPRQAAPIRAECPHPDGRYSLRRTMRGGNCAEMAKPELLRFYTGATGCDEWRFFAGEKTCLLGMMNDCTLPAGRRIAKQTVVWNDDATSSIGDEELSFTFPDGSCSGTYSITYTKL